MWISAVGGRGGGGGGARSLPRPKDGILSCVEADKRGGAAGDFIMDLGDGFVGGEWGSREEEEEEEKAIADTIGYVGGKDLKRRSQKEEKEREIAEARPGLSK